MEKSILRATTVVLLMNLVAKLLGFGREMVIARVFGANMYTDAYLVAYTLPYFLQTILGFALVTVTVPLLTKYLIDGRKEEAFRVGNYFINLVAVFMAFCAVLGVLFAPFLVKITAPLFNAETAAIATGLTRIMFPSVVFMGLGMVVTGILNAQHRFLAAAFAPGFSSFIIIVGLWLVGSNYGIEGLACATLISFLGLLAVQLPSLFRSGYRYRPEISLRHADVKIAMATILPIVLGTAVNQIYFALNRIFASGLAEGSISALNYASKLVNFPSGVFVAAIASAVYPSFSEFVIKGEKDRLAGSLQKGVGMVMLMGIPAAIGLIVLRVPIVQLLFEGGAFTHENTLQTASALLYFSIGLFPFAAILVLTRVFYAFGDVKIPVYAGIAGIAINVATSFLAIGPLAHNGLALANSFAAIANMLIFFVVLKKYLPGLSYRPFVDSFLRIGISSLGMGLAIRFALPVLERVFGTGGDRGLLLVVAIAICGGIALYILLCFLFRIREAVYMKEIISRKIHRK